MRSGSARSSSSRTTSSVSKRTMRGLRWALAVVLLAGASTACQESTPAPAHPQEHGTLDKEVIRRVIRRHLPEVRFCYEKELARSPNLFGRVIVQFTIAGTGEVVDSFVQRSTVKSL